MNQMISTVAMHEWAGMGVSTYPLTHPIVGQGEFYFTFKNFIHLVDQQSEKFAQVFAIVAQWGVGKSRLGYELISQVNDTSPGWFVRNAGGALERAHLFDNETDREEYLGLYIRYSQVATEHHNSDNWFAFGLYKALLPLATATDDGSIQGRIAREAYDRLLPLGFDEAKLAEVMEVAQAHSDVALYNDPYLVTRLCQQAYAYLSQFGIKYLLIALDELETVAETATYGLDDGDIKHLDGRGIKLLGKAIKEEDPRRKLPWLRYVALCSPAIGDELRDIKSTARRFEMVELANNAFADVSDFVRTLSHEGRLSETYPTGLVEAAYAMSSGNFGWFNVIMANVDQILRARRVRGEKTLPTIGEIFAETVKVSSRMRDHVLDYNAIEELKLPDRAFKDVARELLYGQLPVPLTKWQAEERAALLHAKNEFDEPVALLYRRIEVDPRQCADALRAAKFVRDKEVWGLNGVEQALDLRQLLANLSTYAIHEPQNADAGKQVLLFPIRASEFVQLVSLLYPHPAAEDAARALWRTIIGDKDLDESEATHLGPSIAMLERLNLRYRRQSHNALIFRDPDESGAYETACNERKQKSDETRAIDILTGAMRVLDRNWRYDSVSAGLRKFGAALVTTPPQQGGAKGGLVSCDALKLHPKGRLLLAWVRNNEELDQLCNEAASQFKENGRTPVIAFTPSRALVERFANPASDVLKNARGMASPINYFDNTRQAILTTREYAGQNPLQHDSLNENRWGLSACEGPFDEYFAEGAPPAAHATHGECGNGTMRSLEVGTLTVYGVGSSIVHTPNEVLAALWEGERLGLFHPRFGAADAFNLNIADAAICVTAGDANVLRTTGEWRNFTGFGIDHGPMAILIDNYLAGQFTPRLYASYAPIRAALNTLFPHAKWPRSIPARCPAHRTVNGRAPRTVLY